MINFLSDLIIKPLYFIFELLFEQLILLTNNNILITLLVLSFIVSLVCLPLYIRADILKEEETNIQKKLSKRVDSIKKNFKGDEQLLLLQTYYRQNNYHPIMGLRLSLSLLLQIPIFIAAYSFFRNLEVLSYLECSFIYDLSKPDELLRLGNISINIFPILMTFVNIVAGLIYAKNMSFKENKILITISFIFLILLYNSPSALVLYWLFNNIFSLIKNLIIKKIGIEKIKNIDILKNFKLLNFDFKHKQLFILSTITLWIILGLYIPSNVISTSPLEFIFKDKTPISLLKDSSIILAGALLFWGSCIYYFSSTKLKKLYAIIVTLILSFSLINLFLLKMPPAILSNTFVFEIANINFETFNKSFKTLYLIVSLTVLFAISILIMKKKTNILNFLIISVLFSTLSVSTYNCIKIIKKTNAFLKKVENIKADNKYINLSRTNKNVLIIFVDRAISSYLPIVFKEFPKLNEQFKGFTYYPNTLSYAGYTLLGYIPLLGGYEYTPFAMDSREGMFEKKFNEGLTMLPAIFSQNGWKSTIINPIGEGWESETWGGVTQREINILADNKLYEENNIEHYTIPNIIGDIFKEQLVKDDSKLSKRNLIYFSILSISSPKMRNFIYCNGRYHNTDINNLYKYSPLFIKSYAELYNIKNFTDFSSTNNSFIVFNNKLTHYPARLNYPNYDIGKENDLTYKDTIKINDNDYSLKHYHVNVAMLNFLGSYFDFLRENNVFNNTKIIVVADHGFGYNLKNPYLGQFEADHYLPYNPLLLVKDFNENEKLKINKDFMTNADIPSIATLGLIDNPINPFTKKEITTIEKGNGILIKTDIKWQPSFYLGKEKVLAKNDRFNHVTKNPLEHNNWTLNLSLEKAQKIYNKNKI